MEINIKVFYKVIPFSLVDIARDYAQCIQNNRFALSFKYFKNKGRYKVDYQNFLQNNTINFDGHGHSHPKYSKYQVFSLFAIFQRVSEG